ncbi:hypothetical protein CBR_g12533 [Chara braunii]|uniref:Uncharacterized protein n=1 Tax=Chara braunii TaxID=69332 RepID=A0A388JSN7_CHABU|nr:hypothetical protein CBR_g12533 [Chara braunii]|eukprot:GBG60795.1 hypothetical protein CBR_g12533 [Chara braunii]
MCVGCVRVVESGGLYSLARGGVDVTTSFTEHLFPKSSLHVLESFATIGLIFFLFLVGLELDPESLKTAGAATAAISVAGIAVPFVLGVGVAKFLYDDGEVMGDIVKNSGTGFGAFVVFMGVSMSITAFPVLARILAEFKLLTTDVGGLAMAAAAVGDVVAWVFLALAVSLTNSDKPVFCVYDLLMGLLFCLVTFVLVKPFMAKLAQRCPADEPIPEQIVAITLLLCLASAFATDLCGIHAIFGAFLFGLIIPKDGHFAGALIEKVEDFTSTLLLPLYFVSSGLKTEIGSIDSLRLVGVLILVVSVATAGKVGGVYVAARLTKLPPKKSFVFGVLMNTKGLVELIVLNIGREKGVLGNRLFAILVLMAIITTFMTSPIVSLLTAPKEKAVAYDRRRIAMDDGSDEIRLFMCVHGIRNIASMVHVSELVKGRRKKALRVYLLHLIEYSERSSAIKMVAKARKEGKPFVNKNIDGVDNVGTMFQAYGRVAKILVRPMIAIATTSQMHEDICSTAAEKRANMIIVPFHKDSALDGLLDVAHPGFHHVNRNVLRHAPCSVGILVDRGIGNSSHIPSNEVTYHILILFFGGQDDRECLALGRRMLERPNAVVRVVRFKESASKDTSLHVAGGSSIENVSHDRHHYQFFNWTAGSSHDHRHGKLQTIDPAELRRREEEELAKDDAAIADTQATADSLMQEMPQNNGELRFSVEQVPADDVIGRVIHLATAQGVDLVIIGRGRRPSRIVARLPVPEHANRVDAHELGVIGDVLTGKEMKMSASILVVQQHDPDFVPAHTGLSSRLFKKTASHPEPRKADLHAGAKAKAIAEDMPDSPRKADLHAGAKAKATAEDVPDSNTPRKEV